MLIRLRCSNPHFLSFDDIVIVGISVWYRVVLFVFGECLYTFPIKV